MQSSVINLVNHKTPPVTSVILMKISLARKIQLWKFCNISCILSLPFVS